MARSLPLVRLSVLRPIVDGLRERGIDPEIVLDTVGLTEEAVQSDSEAVHVMVVHQFVENAAIAAHDRTFAASIGLRIDTSGWPMLRTAMSEARTLGDFLSIYVSACNKVASSVLAYVEVRGETAVFGEQRLFEPTIEPAQNDGFMAGLGFSILRHVLGRHFDPSSVTVVVCQPDVLPKVFSSCKRLAGDKMGFRIRFPSAWMSLSLDTRHATNEPRPLQEEYSDSFLGSFRILLERRMGSGRISSTAAAAMVGMKQNQLARRLSRFDTDISTEIRRAEVAFAQHRLSHSRLSVGDIAAALGYTDAANFARAFRKVTGMTPTQYRHNARSSPNQLNPEETDRI